MPKTVVGLYHDFDTAENVVRELVNGGFRRDDISVIAHDRAQGRQAMSRDTAYDEDQDAGAHAAAGAGAGAVLGGLAGLVVGLGALAIPGIGPLIAAGPLATALAGAGIGAVTGGLIGALTEAGVPEDEAQVYAEGVRNGNTLVTVRADDDQAQQAVGIMDRYGPIDINSERQQWAGAGTETRTPANLSEHSAPPPAEGQMGVHHAEDATLHRGDTGERHLTTGTYADDVMGQGAEQPGMSARHAEDTGLDQGERHVPIVEEELRVGKREVDRGGMRIHKDVVEQPVEETHNVRDETVNVERRPVDRPATDADLNAFQEQTLEFTETDEELVVDKQAHVVEDVVISKQVEERPETVRDTLRRTEVHTEDMGQGRVASRDFSGFDTEFRNHYDLVYGSRGHDYSFYEPAYRYGYDVAGSDRWQGRRWNEIEPEARREWEQNHQDMPWDDFREAIRHGWERAGSQDFGSHQTGTGWSGGEGYSSGMGEGRYADPNNR